MHVRNPTLDFSRNYQLLPGWVRAKALSTAQIWRLHLVSMLIQIPLMSSPSRSQSSFSQWLVQIPLVLWCSSAVIPPKTLHYQLGIAFLFRWPNSFRAWLELSLWNPIKSFVNEEAQATWTILKMVCIMVFDDCALASAQVTDLSDLILRFRWLIVAIE